WRAAPPPAWKKRAAWRGSVAPRAVPARCARTTSIAPKGAACGGRTGAWFAGRSAARPTPSSESSRAARGAQTPTRGGRRSSDRLAPPRVGDARPETAPTDARLQGRGTTLALGVACEGRREVGEVVDQLAPVARPVHVVSDGELEPGQDQRELDVGDILL